MHTRTLLATGMITTALAVTGCTSTAAGNPQPAPGGNTDTTTPPESTTSAPPSSTDDTYGAPRVDNPLDPGRFLTDPCALLSPEQLASFSITKPGEPSSGIGGDRACDWRAEAISSVTGIGWLTANKNGLADLYRGRDQFGYFEPTTVDGYPAVFGGIGDARATGRCGIVVAISDTITFRVDEAGNLDAQGSCDRATQVAAAAIATIRKG